MDMIAADIGGTKSRFSRFSCKGSKISIKEGVCLSTSAYAGFPMLLEDLFSCLHEDAKNWKKASLLIFAAAGPVRDGRVRMTNASFCVEAAPALKFFPKANCLIINDFEAQAWACLSPAMAEAELILPGRGAVPCPGRFDAAALSGIEGNYAPLAVLGAGTGLGAAWILPCPAQGEHILASEGGHIPFPFESRQEICFARWLAEKLGICQITAEHVLSGLGLAHLYEYLNGKAASPAQFTAHPSFASSQTCAWYARFYGRFCRMAALNLLPQAMVLTGGVVEKSPDLVRHKAFAQEFFHERGEREDLLADIPVWVNRHPQAGLWGAARAAVAFCAKRADCQVKDAHSKA